MKNDYRGPRYHERMLQLIGKGFECLGQNGIVYTWKKTKQTLSSLHVVYGSYRQFMKQPLYTEQELAQQANHDFGEETITISIAVPLFNTPEPFLRDAIESVQAQTYAHWQLCLADGSDDEHGYVQRCCEEYTAKDPRIAYRKLDENRGVAGNSNACLEMVSGDYVALLDHDDVLHPAALFEVAKAAIDQGADFIYTDEVNFSSPNLKDAIFIHFKPDFAPDNLRANNYICHLTAFKRTLLDNAGWFRGGFEGSQDHDLVLRLTAKAKRIVHIPKVLYYWRAYSQSTALDASAKSYAGESGKKAVLCSLEAAGIAARVENAKGIPTIYRCIYELTSTPKVSIVIPNCDHVDDLSTCLTSVQEKSTYRNFEIIVVENNSKELRTYEYYEEILKRWDNVKVLLWDGPFNWSAINNFGVRQAATGDMILLLNNDTEVISPNWIEEMLMFAQREDVGCVGAMLYYPDDTIQHAGVVLGAGEWMASHAFNNVARGEVGYAGKLCYAQNMSAVTGACMLMRRKVWDEIGGCDKSYPVSLNDVDLCMRIRKAGYLIVWTPYAELYHCEGKSRGEDNTPEKRARLDAEEARFKERWAAELAAGDPYYNPNLGFGYFVKRPKKKL